MVTDIVLSVLAAAAQQERLTISERTLAGLRRARKAGKVLGRPIADLDDEGLRSDGQRVNPTALSHPTWLSALLCFASGWRKYIGGFTPP